jgi:DNA-directed RNA polymerase subunit RPC12/RpoP
MALFINFYRCAECTAEWTDTWSATSDDDCPNCGARHISPYKSEDAEQPPQGQKSKLQQLLEIEGFATIEQLAEAILYDTVSPAICMNDGCSYTAEMEPDQDRGWCEECGTNSMKSALVLAGLI